MNCDVCCYGCSGSVDHVIAFIIKQFIKCGKLIAHILRGKLIAHILRYGCCESHVGDSSMGIDVCCLL